MLTLPKSKFFSLEKMGYGRIEFPKCRAKNGSFYCASRFALWIVKIIRPPIFDFLRVHRPYFINNFI